MKEDTRSGWHLIMYNRRLRYGDERVVKEGETYKIPFQQLKPVLCRAGMHASATIFDALQCLADIPEYFDETNARRAHLCKVTVWGNLDERPYMSKFCGRFRRVDALIPFEDFDAICDPILLAISPRIHEQAVNKVDGMHQLSQSLSPQSQQKWGALLEIAVERYLEQREIGE